MTPPCERLPWDSEFFGFPVARVRPEGLEAGRMGDLGEWLASEPVRCVYCLASLDSFTTLEALGRLGFTAVDVKMTFDRTTDVAPSTNEGTMPPIRLATSDDVAPLRQMAGTAHTDSRFFVDSRFPRDRAAELFSVWLERDCNGHADAVWVCGQQGTPLAYVSCQLSKERGVCSLGLVGVHEHHRGRGIGSALLNHTLRWAADSGMARCEVVTQARNIAAVRLYEKMGFRARQVALWLHRWS